MIDSRYPELDPSAIRETRDALHAYAQIVGAWVASIRPRRKHWWQLSLRPTVRGLTTGVVHSSVDFEIELDYQASVIRVRSKTQDYTLELNGQSAQAVAAFLDEALGEIGVDSRFSPDATLRQADQFPGYSKTQAAIMQSAMGSVAAALSTFRAQIREETSPIQVWPHHFDLAMIWLPGHKVSDQDPENEEYADKQMNFGFVFGDEGIQEPYFYVTAYPTPEAMSRIKLPPGTAWKSDGFQGAVLLYRDLLAADNAAEYLVDLWSTLLGAGQAFLATDDEQVKIQ